jgi:hypothetical protein
MSGSKEWEPGAWSVDRPLGLWMKEASRDWPMALANAMAPKESTVTFDFNPSRVCSGMGYLKRGTLGGLAIGEGRVSPGGMGKCNVPITPWWSRKVVGIVSVSSAWSEIHFGSQSVRWSIHDAWSGRWRGMKVGDISPAHLLYGRAAM